MRIVKLMVIFILMSFGACAFADVPVVDGYQQADNNQSDNSSDGSSSSTYSSTKQTTSASNYSALPTDQRVTILERQTANLKQLLGQVSALQQQVQDLRGLVETQSHDLQVLKDQVRDQYADLDQRIGKPTSATSKSTTVKTRTSKSVTSKVKDNPPADTTTGDADSTPDTTVDSTDKLPDTNGNADDAAVPTEDPVNISPQGDTKRKICPSSNDQAAYQDAFKLLKDKKYDAAAAGFQGYIKKYPNSKNLVNARYWLGQLYLLQGQPDKAISQFKTILKNNPSDGKISDTTLQLGLAYYAKGDLAQAKEQLTRVQQKYPSSPAAQLAKTRLNQMMKGSPAPTDVASG